MFIRIVVICMVLMVVYPLNCFSGKLDNFEKSAVTNKKDSEDTDEGEEKKYDTEKSESRKESGKGFFMILLEILEELLKDSEEEEKKEDSIDYRHSNKPLSSRPADKIKPKGLHDPMIKFEYAYQSIDSTVKAYDYRIEGGYGILGVMGRKTEFVEEKPDDYLALYYWHLAWKFSIADKVEISPGLGRIILSGDSRASGSSFTLPIQFYPNEDLGFEFRPTFSKINDNSIRDYEFSVLYGKKNYFVKAGYRSISTPTETLDGPFIGVSVRF